MMGFFIPLLELAVPISLITFGIFLIGKNKNIKGTSSKRILGIIFLTTGIFVILFFWPLIYLFSSCGIFYECRY